MLKTLAEAKASTLRNIAGVPVQSPQFLDRVNEATEALMIRGDWSGTLIGIYACAARGCVVWPRYVGHIRKLNVCNAHIPIRSIWDQFIDDYHSAAWQSCLGPRAKMVAQGKSPAYKDIYGDGRYVRAYTAVQADIGKTLTIFGVDNNNQPLRTCDPVTNLWTEGVKLTLVGAPNFYAQTAMFVRRIDRVLKDMTQGDVRLYAFNNATGLLEDLAVYQPSETNPDYVRYSLSLFNGATCCGDSQGVSALVKLKFVPVLVDTDIVLIESLRALKFMIQSLKFSEAGDDENATSFEKKAIRELNLKEADDNPDDQMVIENNPFQGVYVGQHCW